MSNQIEKFINKKASYILKKGYDAIDEESASWSNRGKDHIKFVIDALEKDLGPEQLVAYNVSQKSDVPKDFYTNYELGKIMDLKNKIFSEWDNDSQSRGYISKYKDMAKLGSMNFGAIRASDLSDEERAKLIDYYNLPKDADLITRNAGRGWVGGTLGGLLGSMPGLAMSQSGVPILVCH